MYRVELLLKIDTMGLWGALSGVFNSYLGYLP